MVLAQTPFPHASSLRPLLPEAWQGTAPAAWLGTSTSVPKGVRHLVQSNHHSPSQLGAPGSSPRNHDRGVDHKPDLSLPATSTPGVKPRPTSQHTWNPRAPHHLAGPATSELLHLRPGPLRPQPPPWPGAHLQSPPLDHSPDDRSTAPIRPHHSSIHQVPQTQLCKKAAYLSHVRRPEVWNPGVPKVGSLWRPPGHKGPRLPWRSWAHRHITPSTIRFPSQ